MSTNKIPFNKPFLAGNELKYIEETVKSGKISGDGLFTQKCHRWLEERYGFKKCLLTTSCTDALEMAAMLIDLQPGDEVVIPSYTFVSTANAFVLHGAKVIFADSYPDNPNIDADKLEKLITPNTRAIVPVHYAGIACDMDKIMALAKKYNLYVIEDAAQAIDSFYNGKPLGSIGHLAAFSFHETKNIISGEGGMLAINDPKFIERAEIIREKGTNRSKFFRGEIDKYSWVDVGSSFLPSDIIAAFLFAQLESLDTIQKQRKKLWEEYQRALVPLATAGKIDLPLIPGYATNNAHMFFIRTKSLEERTALLAAFKEQGIWAVFHYLSLHKSTFYTGRYGTVDLPYADMFTDTLVRLPFFYELKQSEQEHVVNALLQFYKSR